MQIFLANFYTIRAIFNFVPNFVAMAKRDDQGKILGGIRWSIRPQRMLQRTSLSYSRRKCRSLRAVRHSDFRIRYQPGHELFARIQGDSWYSQSLRVWCFGMLPWQTADERPSLFGVQRRSWQGRYSWFSEIFRLGLSKAYTESSGAFQCRTACILCSCCGCHP